MYDTDVDTYLSKQTELYELKQRNKSPGFKFRKFKDVESAINDIKHKLIPESANLLATTHWSLNKDKDVLSKQLIFNSGKDREEYQKAIERAWALINHVDYRVTTTEGETIIE